MFKRAVVASYKTARKIVIGVIGVTVLLFGVALLVLPGPSILVMLLGLGILAAEFAWARRRLEQLREGSSRLLGRFRATPA